MAASIALTATDLSTADLSTYTFTGKAIGAADAGRYVVVVAGHSAGAQRALTSATIGGVSATTLLTVNGADGFSAVHIIIALVPTGTTATVVLNYNNGVLRVGIAVYRLIDLLNGTAYAAGSDTAATSGVVTTTLNVPAGGVAVGCAVTGDGTAWTWSAGLTEDSDQFPESQIAVSSGSGAFGSAQTPLTVTATCGTGSRSALGVVSFDCAVIAGGQPTVKRLGGVPFASPNRGVW